MLTNILREKMPELTQGQAKIARFIMDSPSDAAFMTATQIGNAVGVSQSTVVRFAMLLGYPGFPELRDAMQEVVMEKLTTRDRLEKYDSRNSPNHISLQALYDDLATLQATLEHTKAEEIQAFSQELIRADKIYVVSHLSSRALGYFFWYYLMWFFPHAHLLEISLASETLVNASPQSLVVGISFPRYTRWTVEILEQAKKIGLRTASISSDPLGPLAICSDTYITIPWNPLSFIDSFTAPMSILNCVLLETARILGPKAQEKLEKLEALWQENNVYTS